MALDSIASVLQPELARRQLRSGGWSYFGSSQVSIESTCLGTLALIGLDQSRCANALACLFRTQLSTGAWPAFLPDAEASWTTSLAISTLSVLSDSSDARDRAVDWALRYKGREGVWPWRYKFKLLDRAVKFRPELYGWPWIKGTCSWVIPTGLMMVALKQFVYCKPRPEVTARLRLGAQMLLDRSCPGGGWNAGNSVVYGVPLPAHVESTAIALLGLQGEADHPVIRAAMEWLESAAESEQGISSLSWTVLCRAAYRRSFGEIQGRIKVALKAGCEHLNSATLALAILALRCEEMIHPFIVPV